MSVHRQLAAVAVVGAGLAAAAVGLSYRPAFPPVSAGWVGVVDNRWAAIAVAGAACLMGLVLLGVARRLAQRRRGTEGEFFQHSEVPVNRREQVLLTLVALALIAAPSVALWWTLQRSESGSPGTDVTQQGPAQSGPAEQPAVDHPGSEQIWDRWWVIALALAVTLMLVVATRPRANVVADVTDGHGDVEAHPLTGPLQAGADQLTTSSDPRASVIASYAAMERALAEEDLGRDPAATPDEFLGRIARARPDLADHAGRLTDLFQLARFSTTVIVASQVTAARESFTRLRQHLEERS